MLERYRGERMTPIDEIDREFGPEVVGAVERLKKIAKDKNFESLIQTLKRIMASDGVEISESRFDLLERILSENKRELGLDSEEK